MSRLLYASGFWHTTRELWARAGCPTPNNLIFAAQATIQREIGIRFAYIARSAFQLHIRFRLCHDQTSMNRIMEYHEGPAAWNRFTKAMRGVVAVSRDEMQRRIEEERQKSLANPNRRGPKRKAKA